MTESIEEKTIMRSISETTLIPISLVITIIGGVIWMTTLWARTENYGARITKVEVTQEMLTKQMTDSNLEIIKQLSKIEGKMERDSK